MFKYLCDIPLRKWSPIYTVCTLWWPNRPNFEQLLQILTKYYCKILLSWCIFNDLAWNCNNAILFFYYIIQKLSVYVQTYSCCWLPIICTNKSSFKKILINNTCLCHLTQLHFSFKTFRYLNHYYAWLLL